MYHDLIRGGKYTFVVEEMHRKYGPVVRIMPDVLHVNDPAFVDKLYTQSPAIRRERAWTMLQLFVSHQSSLATRDHDLHRHRRAVISRFFSQANVRRLTPVIDRVLQNLLRRLDGFAKTGEVVKVQSYMQAATKDVIQSYALGEGRQCLDMEDMNAPFFALIGPGRGTHVTVHLHFVMEILNSLPPSIVTYLDEKVQHYILFLQVRQATIHHLTVWILLLTNTHQSLTAEIEQVRKVKDHPEAKSIFQEILNSNIPESEKQTQRLLDEAAVMTVAGTDTTAATLKYITFYVLSEPAIFARLRTELDEAIPDPAQSPDPAKLDNLPYLNALIEETLRLYPTATHRQDRVAPDEDLVYHYPDGSRPDIVIPRGTAIGMTARIINRHPGWYGDDADLFRPERYLENPKLMRRTLTFSKGGRQCIGINLAYQELQYFIAGIFRKYSPYDPSAAAQKGPTLELVDTTIEDVELYGDFITPGHAPGRKGVQVKVRSE